MTASRQSRAAWWTAMVIGLPMIAAADFDIPFLAGAAAPIANEHGAPLAGGANGSLVTLHWASNSIVLPPAADGTPDPSNPEIPGGVSYIGQLSNPDDPHSGLFGLVLGSALPNGAKVFVRVFNAPTHGEASFYGDSQVFTVSDGKAFDAQVGGTTNPLTIADTDGDGLHDSWEKSYGSDPNIRDSDADGIEDGEEHALGLSPVLADTDTDGMNDGHELRAGTLAGDPDSYLGLDAMTPAGANLVVTWMSVAGMSYQVERCVGGLPPAGTFVPASGIIPASAGAFTSTILTNALDTGGIQLYRILLIEE